MDLPAVEQYLKGLQRSICDELSAIDGAASFERLKPLGYDTIEAHEHCAEELLDWKRSCSFEDRPPRPISYS